MTRVLGMISGTSHDGIDLAVVDFTVVGDVLEAEIEYTATTPYPRTLRDRLLTCLPPAEVGLAEVCRLDTEIGQAFAAAAAAAVRENQLIAPSRMIDAVSSHGQTVYHWVEAGRTRGTLQVGQPAWIAEATGLPVISDFRSADVAAGGQGAPLVPALDRLLLAHLTAAGRRVGALNLGGIANITVFDTTGIIAWDIGPANALIDAVITADLSTEDTYDRDGTIAASGDIQPALLSQLLDEPYYARNAPKSCGKELFHLDYVHDALRRYGTEPSHADLIATLTELTAVTVARDIRSNGIETLIISGGGAHNPVLMRRITQLIPHVDVLTSDTLGVPPDAKEAVAFALLGWATMHGLPGNLVTCTGAREPRILGSLTPAPNGALPISQRLNEWPASLHLKPRR